METLVSILLGLAAAYAALGLAAVLAFAVLFVWAVVRSARAARRPAPRWP